jgi:uncharacterized phage protein gp47/JayE
MPFSRPSLTELRATAIQDITTSGVPGLDGLLRNAVLRVLAMVMSGLAYLVYGYLDWIALEAVPFTATDEFLDAWAALVGIHRKDATPAAGTGAQFSGTAGLTVRQGAALTRQDGIPYTATADATVGPDGLVTVPVVAAIDGGATNADVGMFVSLDQPPAGINAGGRFVGPITGGSDIETNDELRTRMLFRYAQPPQGGAESDYVEWATEVPGVTRAWVNGNGMGPGTVVVYPMFDIANAAHGGFPQGTDGCAALEARGPTASGDQLIVADHIYPLRPVTALVFVIAPVPLPIDVTLAALDPGDAATRAAIVASLEDMFLSTAVVGGTVWPSQLYAAISGTDGVHHFDIVSPAAPVVVAAGQLPVMGTLDVV